MTSSSSLLSSDSIVRQLEELHLLKCSLLQGEEILFIPSSSDAETWQALLDSYPDHNPELLPSSAAKFQVKSDKFPNCFEVQLPHDYGVDDGNGDRLLKLISMIAVRGNEISRWQQERWQQVVKESVAEVEDTFELISTYLLPKLYAEIVTSHMQVDTSTSLDILSTSNAGSNVPYYHALFTSHHLISPTKRRHLQQWTHQLSISGFAKVGYPGVIYCEGSQRNVEEFVANVKAMQWLALRVRFMEPLLQDEDDLVQRNVREDTGQSRSWIEFEKIGDVVQEMRRLGRESYVVEMGIGIAAT